MAPSTELAAFPGFLDLLSRGASADEVVVALSQGPLKSFEPISTGIGVLEDGFVRFIGLYGGFAEFHDRYHKIPLSYDWPASRSAMYNEIADVAIKDVFTEYPTLEVDRDLWQPLFRQTNGGDGRLVMVPTTMQGSVTGVVGFITPMSQRLGLTDSTMLLGIAAAVALWLKGVHQATLTDELFGYDTDELPLILSPRQKQLLSLVADGRSNSTIAHMLGYSLSTVKLDLNRAKRSLRVSDRESAAQRARDLGLLGDEQPAQLHAVVAQAQ